MIVTVVAFAEAAGNCLTLNDHFRSYGHHLPPVTRTTTGKWDSWRHDIAIADLPLLRPLRNLHFSNSAIWHLDV